MSEAILAAAENRPVSGMAAQIARAAQVNRMLGTQLAPWEFEQMPAEWVTALEMWVDELPRAREWKAEVNAAVAKLRKRSRHGA